MSLHHDEHPKMTEIIIPWEDITSKSSFHTWTIVQRIYMRQQSYSSSISVCFSSLFSDYTLALIFFLSHLTYRTCAFIISKLYRGFQSPAGRLIVSWKLVEDTPYCHSYKDCTTWLVTSKHQRQCGLYCIGRKNQRSTRARDSRASILIPVLFVRNREYDWSTSISCVTNHES